MKYYFELRKDKTDKNELIPIRLVVKSDNIRIRKNIPAKVRLVDWDKHNSYIKNPKDNDLYKEYSNYSKVITNVKDKVDRIFNYFDYNNIPFSKDIFDQKFDNKEEVKVSVGFFDAFEEYIQLSKLTKAKSTITKIKSVKNFISDFVAHSGYNLRLDNVDYRFEEAFKGYCFSEKRTLNNYYAKIIKTLKAFLNWALDRGYHDSIEFKKIRNRENDIEVIYLTTDELTKLYNHDFKNDSKDRARDMFCFLCFTGQRHVDIYNLSNTNFNGSYLNFTVTKTKTVDHRVFLIKEAKEIINKYVDTIYYPVPRLSSQKLNKTIQECCEEIGLTQEVELTRFIGPEVIKEKFRKCDIITSHVGRKTFITNSLIIGISERIVRSVSNHKDEKTFRKYVNISEKHEQKELEKWDSLNI